MEVKELRIGNWVLVDNEMRDEHMAYHQITEVRSIDCQVSFYGSDVVYGQYHKFIKPIPLTEEWLFKFGFKSGFATDPQEESASKVFDFNGFEIYMPNENKQEFIYSSCVGIIYLKYAHKMQNLYFELKGDELSKIN